MPLDLRPLQSAHRHDFMDAYVSDLPNVARHARHPPRPSASGRPMAGQRRLLWGHRRTAQAGTDRGQPAGRCDVAIHDAGPRRQDPMDCSSPNAMASLIAKIGTYQIATGNDADTDRHGIVTPTAG